MISVLLVLFALCFVTLPAGAQSYPDGGAVQHGFTNPYGASNGQAPSWLYSPITPQDLGQPPAGYEHPVQVDDSTVEGSIVPNKNEKTAPADPADNKP